MGQRAHLKSASVVVPRAAVAKLFVSWLMPPIATRIAGQAGQFLHHREPRPPTMLAFLKSEIRGI